MLPGPVMLDIEGTELSGEDRARLLHPLTGGVILFSRNYTSREQLTGLVSEIRALRIPPLLVAVDHEGGRVQRFRDGFTRLPAMRALGMLWDRQPRQAMQLARETGYVLAAELRACGVDMSFTPVLDIDYGSSSVIGDRAFHRQPQAIADLGRHLMLGLKDGGMMATGKHFPGHGYIEADSHVAMPVDHRCYADIEMDDLIPFRQMINTGLAGIMPAHVVYPQVDVHPAGFSAVWLKQVLRGEMGFDGCIFSDDLSMEGATVAGGIVQRATLALRAGCDMVLVCNQPAAADELLTGLVYDMPAVSQARLVRMHGRPHPDSLMQLQSVPGFTEAVRHVCMIGVGDNELPLA